MVSGIVFVVTDTGRSHLKISMKNKLDQKTINQIEHALSLVQFGEVIIVVHEGQIQGIDVKNRKRIVDKSIHKDVDSK